MIQILKTLGASVVLLLTASNSVYAEDCDLDMGKKVYAICAACHGQPDNEKPPLGPTLKSLFGRKAGSQPDFIYSIAMEEYKVIWNKDTLNTYLENPMTLVPGTSMAFAGIKDDQQRRDLICWIENFETKKPD